MQLLYQLVEKLTCNLRKEQTIVASRQLDFGDCSQSCGAICWSIQEKAAWRQRSTCEAQIRPEMLQVDQPQVNKAFEEEVRTLSAGHMQGSASIAYVGSLAAGTGGSEGCKSCQGRDVAVEGRGCSPAAGAYKRALRRLARQPAVAATAISRLIQAVSQLGMQRARDQCTCGAQPVRHSKGSQPCV